MTTRLTCKLPGCNMSPKRGYGWCHFHRENWKKYGTPTPSCGVPDCDRPLKNNGWCHLHDQRVKAHGTPYLPEPLPAGPLLDYITAAGGLTTVMDRIGIAYHCRDDYKRWEKTIARVRKAGHLNVAAADHIACNLLRVHPSVVYGDAWWVPEHQLLEAS